MLQMREIRYEIGLSHVLLSTFLVFGCGINKDLGEKPPESVPNIDPVASQTQQSQSEPDSSDIASLNIINGLLPSPQAIQHTVGLSAGESICSASIISKSAILTADHCVTNPNVQMFVVFNQAFVQGANVRPVKQVFRGPETGMPADVAIVTFDGGLPAGYQVVPMLHPNVIMYRDQNVRIAGYGISNVAAQTSGRLLEGASRLIGVNFQRRVLVMDGVANTNLCFGDSGGPTFTASGSQYVLLGVTSSGESEVCDGITYVVDVRQIKDWIDQRLVAAGSEPALYLGGGVSFEAPANVAAEASPLGLISIEQELIELVNQQRTLVGLLPLSTNGQLIQAAKSHTQDMALFSNLSHTGSNGSTPASRIAGTGYLLKSSGQNIAAGHTTASSVMSAWMQSPEHRANILNAAYADIGVSVVKNADGKIYWTQVFGSK